MEGSGEESHNGAWGVAPRPEMGMVCPVQKHRSLDFQGE